LENALPEAATAQTKDDLVPLAEEQIVVRRLKNGDRSAVATLYNWYGDKLYRATILPRLPNIERAEDVLRDTFRTVLEKIETFQTHETSIFFWMRTIAIRKTIDAHRQTKRDRKLAQRIKDAESVPMGQAPPGPDHNLLATDLKRAIDMSMERINPRYARALRMRLLEEKSREVCAADFEITVATFDVLFYRACKAFRGAYPP
jgi:RNA polymerase sigma factor (sigma-70 family)